MRGAVVFREESGAVRGRVGGENEDCDNGVEGHVWCHVGFLGGEIGITGPDISACELEC